MRDNHFTKKLKSVELKICSTSPVMERSTRMKNSLLGGKIPNKRDKKSRPCFFI